MALTKEQEIAELKRKLNVLKSDFPLYCERILKVKNKDGKIEPFVLNDAQRYIYAQLKKQRDETGKNRAIVLKGRQQGVSTLSGGLAMWSSTLTKGQSVFIIAQDSQATSNLWNLAKRYYDNLPDQLKPAISTANIKELVFPGLDSSFRCGTAGSAAVGRSATINFLHISELAFWTDAERHFAGLVQTVPSGNGSTVLIESTANGVGGRYHSLWQEAKRGESEYIAIFVPWTMQSEYRKHDPNFKPTDEELNLKELYAIDFEQLCWRRAKVQELGPQLFQQEYPFTEAEAFLSSGRTVFDKDSTAAALRECWSPKKRKLLENGRWIERKDGELKVWAEPITGSRYAIGADVSEGVGRDFSSADVLEVRTGEQVAHWHGQISPDLFGGVLASLGRHYNNALVCCEANNHGLTTNIYLRDTERYNNIYSQTTLDDMGSNEKATRKLGFNTNRRSKPFIIDQLSALFRENDTGIACAETIQECQTYIVLDDSSYAAAPNCFDDRVMSMAIANYAVQQCPAHKKKKA